MRLEKWTFALALMGLVAWGCDDNHGGEDAGGTVDAGRDGAIHDPDSGPGHDGGPRDGGGCGSLTLPAIGYEDVVVGSPWSGRGLVGLVQPQGSEDLYVVDQLGFVVIVRDGAVVPTPFLDLTDRIAGPSSGDELGLLGLAFHPQYATNGRFFVYYTEAASGGTYNDVLVELHRSSNPDVADTTEVARLLELPDPQWNHNGGQLAFGPDGYLYLGVGDGGNGYDTGAGHDSEIGNGQSTTVGLGKIHRIDVDDASGDSAPADNPFVGGGGLPTIWAYGLRNPWRFSFDRATGDLWIADVGQDDWEEIDFQPASSNGGENYGWAAYEGSHRLTFPGYPAPDASVFPVFEYPHRPDGTSPFDSSTCAVVGGFVYRGSAIAGLQGWYLFGDFCSTQVIAARVCDGMLVGTQEIPSVNGLVANLTSFGEDQSGELYLVGANSLVRLIAP